MVFMAFTIYAEIILFLKVLFSYRVLCSFRLWEHTFSFLVLFFFGPIFTSSDKQTDSVCSMYSRVLRLATVLKKISTQYHSLIKYYVGTN